MHHAPDRPKNSTAGTQQDCYKTIRKPLEMLTVPYFSQYDNASGYGWRECFSSSVAMLLAYRKAVESDDAYNIIRSKFGDTIESRSHLIAVTSLNLFPEYLKNADRSLIEQEIGTGRPIAVGWLHRGTPAAPSGGGHWSVIVGSRDSFLWMHDPAGEPDLVNGGHIPGTSGRAVKCTWKNFLPRWSVAGPADGWAFKVRG